MSAFESIWRCYYRESFKFYRHKQYVFVHSVYRYTSTCMLLFSFFFIFFCALMILHCFQIEGLLNLAAACSSALLFQQHLLNSHQCITFCYFSQYSNIFRYYYNCYRISDLCHCSCRKIANHWSLTWGKLFNKKAFKI